MSAKKNHGFPDHIDVVDLGLGVFATSLCPFHFDDYSACSPECALEFGVATCPECGGHSDECSMWGHRPDREPGLPGAPDEEVER